jgi:hypothetical protein
MIVVTAVGLGPGTLKMVVSVLVAIFSSKTGPPSSGRFELGIHCEYQMLNHVSHVRSQI